MKLAIFGATGGTGRALVQQALAAGHQVTAMARNTSVMMFEHDLLTVMAGNIFNLSEVEAVVAGQDAIVSTLGTNQRAVVTVCGEGNQNIIQAMKKHNVRRLIAVSAYGVADSHHFNPYNWVLWLSLRQKMLDKERMEALIRQSALDWTLVRPSFLTDGEHTGTYRYGNDLRMGLTSHISRTNVADFILKHLSDPTTFKQAVSLTS